MLSSQKYHFWKDDLFILFYFDKTKCNKYYNITIIIKFKITESSERGSTSKTTGQTLINLTVVTKPKTMESQSVEAATILTKLIVPEYTSTMPSTPPKIMILNYTETVESIKKPDSVKLTSVKPNEAKTYNIMPTKSAEISEIYSIDSATAMEVTEPMRKFCENNLTEAMLSAQPAVMTLTPSIESEISAESVISTKTTSPTDVITFQTTILNRSELNTTLKSTLFQTGPLLESTFTPNEISAHTMAKMPQKTKFVISTKQISASEKEVIKLNENLSTLEVETLDLLQKLPSSTLMLENKPLVITENPLQEPLEEIIAPTPVRRNS